MKTVATNLKQLYTSDQVNADQPYRSITIAYLQGSPPKEDETITLEDGGLRIGVKAKVVEILDDNKINVLIPMREVYSLDPNAGIPESMNQKTDPFFYSPSRPPNAYAPDNPYASSGFPSSSTSAKAKPEVKIVDEFSASALLALIVSALSLFVFFYWEDFAGLFLVMNSPFDGLLYLATDEARNVEITKLMVWAVTLAPLLAVCLCWKHWSCGGDGITGGLGSIVTSLAAGFSSLLLFAAVVLRGWFGDVFTSSTVDSYETSDSSLTADQAGLFVWLGVSAVWFLIILTGMAAKEK